MAPASVGVTTPKTMPPTIITGRDNAGSALNKLGQNGGRSSVVPPGWFFRWATIELVIIIIKPNNNPGMIPAINKAPIDSCNNAPYRIKIVLGGMTGPTTEEVAVMAAAYAPG